MRSTRIEVRDPHGRDWTVRCYVVRRPRWRGTGGATGAGDAFGSSFVGDSAEDLLIGIASPYCWF
jgi:hypothetical protein